MNPNDDDKRLEDRLSDEGTFRPLFGNRPWRDTRLYSIDENGYYVSEKHPHAAKIFNTYLRFSRWLLGVKYET